MAKKTYQIKISLKNSKPKIWRRIVVNSDMNLFDFHKIIQTTMGWSNSHLHLFSDGFEEFAPKELEIEDAKNSRSVRLDKVLRGEKTKILYEYDFGDGWDHEILLEKILAPDDPLQIPKCIAGKRNCPPEDCGGVWGYEKMLEILKQPDHEEYEGFIEWLGEEFDPDFFDMDEINKWLKQRISNVPDFRKYGY